VQPVVGERNGRCATRAVLGPQQPPNREYTWVSFPWGFARGRGGSRPARRALPAFVLRFRAGPQQAGGGPPPVDFQGPARSVAPAPDIGELRRRRALMAAATRATTGPGAASASNAST